MTCGESVKRLAGDELLAAVRSDDMPPRGAAGLALAHS